MQSRCGMAEGLEKITSRAQICFAGIPGGERKLLLFCNKKFSRTIQAVTLTDNTLLSLIYIISLGSVNNNVSNNQLTCMVLHKLVPHFVDYIYALSLLPNQAENTMVNRGGGQTGVGVIKQISDLDFAIFKI